LFTSVLNARLLKVCENNDILTDAQFGFRPDVSTVDAIFALNVNITKTLSGKNKLYCCFVDFCKTFDHVDRISLWYKLSNIGIRGQFFQTVKSLYKCVKSCVTINGLCSDFFVNKLGFLQGENLSPIFFSLFVNDFE